MALAARPVEYYYATVREELDATRNLLADLDRRGVSLLGFAVFPLGPDLTQFTIFPDDATAFVAEAAAAGLDVHGPHHALLVSGDEGLAALAAVHERLAASKVEVYASSGARDASGSFGYLLYVREEQFDEACGVLGCDSPELRLANDWLDVRAVVLGRPSGSVA